MGVNSSSERTREYPNIRSLRSSGCDVDGQPDGVRPGGGNPMAPSGGDQQPVSGGEGKVLAVVEFELGTALGQHHPLVVGLVVPEARWAGVAVGYDAFDTQPRPAQQGLEGFIRAGGRKRGKEVLAGQGACETVSPGGQGILSAGWRRENSEDLLKKAAPG